MAWIKLDPITRRRFAKFRQIKRGYYSLLILLAAIVLSIFAPYLAESRALVVYYKGQLYFPTFQFFNMATFQQTSATRLERHRSGSGIFTAQKRMAHGTLFLRSRTVRSRK
jgi:ABC-type microcin C transport system permease subunit YejE